MTGEVTPPFASGTSSVAGNATRSVLDARREDDLHRVQIGLTGLAGVILLVGMANIVINKARLDERMTPPPVVQTRSTNPANATSPREPLAELGVTPSAEQSGQVVPDLQPDPALDTPMDHDPQ